MTNKNKKYITDAMIYPNAGVLRVLLEYIDNIEKLAHIEGFGAGSDKGFDVGYLKGFKDGYNNTQMSIEWEYAEHHPD